jgi:cytochrome c nitrite reductase small subunit
MLASLAKAISRMWAFLAGLLFAILCFVGLNAAMVPLSKSEYCGSSCHEMNTAYLSWELSPHGTNAYGVRVECVDCHLPPKEEYSTHLAAKAYEGAKDIYVHYFGGPYDTQKIRKRVSSRLSNQRCLHCHDHLLDKPGSPAARTAHMAVLAEPGAPENRCVQCHEDAGHQRHSKLFSP